MPHTAGPGQKQLNRAAVFQEFLREDACTRDDVIQSARLSRSTVDRVFRELQAIGAIQQVGHRPSLGGRPHELYQLAPDFLFAVSVDFSIPDYSITITDMRHTIIWRGDRTLGQTRGMAAEDIIRMLHVELQGAMHSSGISPERVLSVNISIPGFVVNELSTIQNRDIDGWVDVPLRQKLEQLMAIPTVVRNDAVNMLTAELHAQGELDPVGVDSTPHTLYLALRRDSGNELRIGSAYSFPYNGHPRVFPGSISHLPTGLPTAVCRCGNSGCLEQVLQLHSNDGLLVEESLEPLARVLASSTAGLCRFTEASRLILDLQDAGELHPQLFELICAELKATLSAAPLQRITVQQAVVRKDAALHGAALSGMHQTLSNLNATASVLESLVTRKERGTRQPSQVVTTG